MSTNPEKQSAPPDAPNVCRVLFECAARSGASDVHIQPRPDGTAQVTFRQDGVLRPERVIPAEVAAFVIGRIKFLARLKTFENSLPQDGRIEPKDSGISQDLRVSTYPTISGEKVVIRFFTEQPVYRLEELGLALGTLDQLQQFLRRRQGLLLLTGPSGSGKTTTIYSCLNYLVNTDCRHIITVEDPVEQLIDGVMQTEINPARGLDYPKALRHLLRQDPEVIVIGEIRDEATAEIAVRACLTGHQVIATLHAGSCHGVLDRLRVMVQDRHALATVIDTVLNQRLARRLCPSCSGKTCHDCSQTGYQGRVPLVETLPLSTADQKRFSQGDPPETEPEPTLRQAGNRLVDLGITDSRELSRILGS